VWLFRQAGRHLPEYNAYKIARGKNFLQLLEDPADVAEVTLQPVRRYNVDAAILFSDILVLLQSMGMEIAMPGGSGITVPNPITTTDELYQRISHSPIDVKQKLPHIFEAVRLIKKQLDGRVPLIGFSAAPWTLMYYILGGTSKSKQRVAASWLRNFPNESRYLLDVLTRLVLDYLYAQVEAGVDLVQVFEAMGEHIGKDDFMQWALPCVAHIAREFKHKYPDVPLMVFPRGACYALEALQSAGYDVVTMDSATDRHTVRSRLQSATERAGDLAGQCGRPARIQGNFDVRFLSNVPGGNAGNTPGTVRTEVGRMLQALGPQNLIANLGEGLTGTEDPTLVAAFVDATHELSEQLISRPYA
jgi:uroporphyrinogen decarboxylase